VPSWNRDAVAIIERQWSRDGRLVVFTPELREGVLSDYTGQIDWEHRHLHWSDVIMFWVPRDLDTMPALTTNIEWGTWAGSGKVVFGAPPTAPKNEYLRHLAETASAPVADTLEDTVAAALAMLGTGARRTGGERSVPQLVWNSASFQAWYRAQRAAGNTLLDARVEWTLRVGPRRETLVYWAAHVQVHVAAEDRVKANEVVLSRPDTSQVLLYVPGPTTIETTVVLVREFRSPASTGDGFVHELPGGSGADGAAPSLQAAEEVEEETGLVLAADRLRAIGSRQVAATVSAHRAHLFAAEITAEELAWLRARQAVPGGVGETERTWIEIWTYAELLASDLVDWATLGMVTRALNGT
jgi:8-oxo-dGTP pyrophosphatase MutT (NUDIX family)